MKLDVAGIAVGYVVDEALDAITQAGVDRALIDAGGDLGMTGPPPGANGWRVAIQSLEAPDETTGEYVELSNASISTSGDTLPLRRDRRHPLLAHPRSRDRPRA